ncbi:hypothetical protein VP01_304g1 [Puccinia sorghi]|uniref:Uncharacterized protein n=1 Tax=Puccinia sorghi TaxID=27349 RepID=A0A0L6V1Q7_9BASI|nr:hypothetical protein VP01_304g1 [Puccinia sorghi]
MFYGADVRMQGSPTFHTLKNLIHPHQKWLVTVHVFGGSWKLFDFMWLRYQACAKQEKLFHVIFSKLDSGLSSSKFWAGSLRAVQASSSSSFWDGFCRCGNFIGKGMAASQQKLLLHGKLSRPKTTKESIFRAFTYGSSRDVVAGIVGGGWFWGSEKDWADKSCSGGHFRGKPGQQRARGSRGCAAGGLRKGAGGGVLGGREWSLGGGIYLSIYHIEKDRAVGFFEENQESSFKNHSRQNIHSLFPGYSVQRAVIREFFLSEVLNTQRTRTLSYLLSWVFFPNNAGCLLVFPVYKVVVMDFILVVLWVIMRIKILIDCEHFELDEGKIWMVILLEMSEKKEGKLLKFQLYPSSFLSLFFIIS